MRLAKWLTILLYWATDQASTRVLPRCMICLAKRLLPMANIRRKVMYCSFMSVTSTGRLVMDKFIENYR